MAKTRTRVDNKKWIKIQKEVSKFKKLYTAIGLHEGSNYPDGTSLPMVGFIHEYGTGNMPERSFIRAWVDTNKAQINRMTDTLYGKVIDGKLNADRAIKLLGEFAEGGIKKYMTELKSPANAESTIKAKGSSNPLIDTGIMRANIKHKEGRGKIK